MATYATAYDSSAELKSAKSAPPAESPLLRRIEHSRLPLRYRASLKYFILASKHGPDYFASTWRAAKWAAVSYRTMQRHLDWLERERILKLKHQANKFYQPGHGIRRTATYNLGERASDFFSPRETPEQWERSNRRKAPPRKKSHRSTERSTMPKPESAAPVASVQAAHAEEISRSKHRALELYQKLGKRMQMLMSGYTYHCPPEGGIGHRLRPGDENYIEPLSREESLCAVAAEFGLSPDEVAERLKFWKYTVEKKE